jgi:hypothetical protein
LHDILSCDGAIHSQIQSFSAVFIHDRKPLQAASIIGLVVDKIVGPNLVDSLRSSLLARVCTTPPALFDRTPDRHLEPLLLPKAMNSLLINLPAFTA